ncbi:hypothetical protein GGR53DRAFT_154097 [Hypoxylon sp. FL1150]|nr:hypothetical protein GGR53DRAFT_154097 [Hypoxylon sp. FL1150]
MGYCPHCQNWFCTSWQPWLVLWVALVEAVHASVLLASLSACQILFTCHTKFDPLLAYQTRDFRDLSKHFERGMELFASAHTDSCWLLVLRKAAVSLDRMRQGSPSGRSKAGGKLFQNNSRGWASRL